MAWTRQGHSATRPVTAGGKHAVFSETSINNSNKVFEVGVDCEEAALSIKRIRVELTTSATVGSRAIAYALESSSGDVLASQTQNSNDNVVASGSGIVEFAEFALRQPGQAPGDEVREHLLSGLVLTGGMKLRVWDAAAIDPTADDMVVHIATKLLE